MTDSSTKVVRDRLCGQLPPPRAGGTAACRLITVARLQPAGSSDGMLVAAGRRRGLPTAHKFGFSNTDEAFLAVHVRCCSQFFHGV